MDLGMQEEWEGMLMGYGDGVSSMEGIASRIEKDRVGEEVYWQS